MYNNMPYAHIMIRLMRNKLLFRIRCFQFNGHKKNKHNIIMLHNKYGNTIFKLV